MATTVAIAVVSGGLGALGGSLMVIGYLMSQPWRVALGGGLLIGPVGVLWLWEEWWDYRNRLGRWEPRPTASFESLRPCPECAAGKHQNCDGATWSDLTDRAMPCPCRSCTPPAFDWRNQP
ncbi:MAG: hypothetical protein IE926_16780 [Micrococcales bacterium]|nr:hypothetical protein [Micrococcales bacterium]